MVVEIKLKNHEFKKYIKVVACGVLSSHKDKLYVQTRVRGNVAEMFFPLTDVVCYTVREAFK